MSLPEPFSYPIEPHLRKHAPAGYANYTEYKPWLRDEFDFRCVYCLQREAWSRAGAAVFSVDHIIPQAFDPDFVFTCDYTNLLYACLSCNSLRQDEIILDPTRDGMGEHLSVHTDGTVTGRTFDGLVLVRLLHLNRPSAIRERQRILRILHRRVHYPDDHEILRDFRETFGYPDRRLYQTCVAAHRTALILLGETLWRKMRSIAASLAENEVNCRPSALMVIVRGFTKVEGVTAESKSAKLKILIDQHVLLGETILDPPILFPTRLNLSFGLEPASQPSREYPHAGKD